MTLLSLSFFPIEGASSDKKKKKISEQFDSIGVSTRMSGMNPERFL